GGRPQAQHGSRSRVDAVGGNFVYHSARGENGASGSVRIPGGRVKDHALPQLRRANGVAVTVGHWNHDRSTDLAATAGAVISIKAGVQGASEIRGEIAGADVFGRHRVESVRGVALEDAVP